MVILVMVGKFRDIQARLRILGRITLGEYARLNGLR